jgi:hypothetical protein
MKAVIASVLFVTFFSLAAAYPVDTLVVRENSITMQPRGQSYEIHCEFGEVLQCTADSLDVIQQKQKEPRLSSEKIYLD